MRVQLTQIYECLCDETRLRLLNVLSQGPMCVCNFQKVLQEPQVKISKHLAYLRARGLVECQRERNWMIYRIPAEPSPELKANLACLQDCVREQAVFREDLGRLTELDAEDGPAASPHCTEPEAADSLLVLHDDSHS